MRSVGNMRLETPGDRTIEMSRDFDAPKQLVFDAYTKPELVQRWLGVHNGFTMPVCEIDLRVGGSYRFVWEGPGMKMGMRGVYREIATPDRVVATEKFDDAWYPGEAIDIVTFVESRGKTRSRSPSSTRRRKRATPCSRRRWSNASPLASTSSPRCLPHSPESQPLLTTLKKAGRMIETPQIVQTEAQLIAAIHLTIPGADMPKVMGPGFNELQHTLEHQHITPTGRWLNHHFRMPRDTFDFEIALPVDDTVAATERVKMSQLPATKALRTVYHGGYEGLGNAWGELIAWAKANDHKFSGEFWEQYTVGPEAGDSSNYRTELTLALAD